MGALHLAAAKGYSDISQLLLSSGIAPDMQDNVSGCGQNSTNKGSVGVGQNSTNKGSVGVGQNSTNKGSVLGSGMTKSTW